MTYQTNHHDLFIIEIEPRVVFEIRVRGAKPVQVVARNCEEAKKLYLEKRL